LEEEKRAERVAKGNLAQLAAVASVGDVEKKFRKENSMGAWSKQWFV